MKRTPSAIAFALSLWLGGVANAAAPTEKIIEGAGGSKLTFSNWSTEENGWHAVQWQGADGKGFTLYPHEFARDAVDGDSKSVSPDGHFVMLYRLRQSGRQFTPPTLRCDMVSMDTGCVLATRLAEYCVGSWTTGAWQPEGKVRWETRLQTLRPAKVAGLLQNSENREMSQRKAVLAEEVYMGLDSYMACHPPKDNVPGYNDMGYLIGDDWWPSLVLRIYRAIEPFADGRRVLQLNIADILWAFGNSREAGAYYARYRQQMLEAGAAQKIPPRVQLRLDAVPAADPDR